jgi:conjugative relaxase-like TrwC/TraI family protein
MGGIFGWKLEKGEKMLSPKRINEHNARDYHANQKDYYGLAKGEWFGALKEHFGLKDLNQESFNQLLAGVDTTTGKSFLPSKKNRQSNCAAIDLTITSPKSFGILVQMFEAKGDSQSANKLLGYYNQAVDATLSHIQQEYAASKVQKKKVKKIEKSRNLLIAKFQHDDSRPVTDPGTKEVYIDCNLHTHCVAMNFTQGLDGKFRALEAKKIFDDKIKLGTYFRAELANILVDNGIQIDETDKENTFWKIASIPETLIKEFSKRSEQIENEFQRLKKLFPKMDKAKLKQKATLSSREKKKITIPRNQIKEHNLRRAEKHIDVDSLLDKFRIHLNGEKKIQKVNIDISKQIDSEKLELKKMRKFHQNRYMLLQQLAKQMLGQIKPSEIFKQIKNKELHDKKELKTMHQVVVLNLDKTRLNTEKLYSKLYKLDKIKMEENFENRRGKIGNRDRFTEIFSRVSSELAEAKRTHYRDATDSFTIAERGRESGANPQRTNATANRDVGVNIEAVTARDIQVAERGNTQQSKGIEQ